jgi:hypothetical protein
MQCHQISITQRAEMDHFGIETLLTKGVVNPCDFTRFDIQYVKSSVNVVGPDMSFIVVCDLYKGIRA